MKLRSHEILSSNKKPIRSPHPSRIKQLFQGKNVFKKKLQQHSSNHHGLAHTIPDYVRKSLFRFLLETKSPPSPPPSPPPTPPECSSPPQSRIRQTPLMGIRALKTKQQHLRNQPKRSLRIKQQQQQQQETVTDNNKSFEDNYDMTILHMNADDIDNNNDDDDDDSFIFATKTSTNQKKPIPQWARKNELQIAICNQIYFHRNPSEIFGNTMDCSPAHLRTILHSMLPKVDLSDDNLYQS